MALWSVYGLYMFRMSGEPPANSPGRLASTVSIDSGHIRIEEMVSGKVRTIRVSEIRGISVESGFVCIDLANGKRVWFSTPGMPAWHFLESIQGVVGR